MDDDELRRTAALAAFECIVERGVDGLSLEHVAEETGVSRGDLDRLYDGKTQLLTAVLESITREFWGTMTHEGPAPERLRFHLRSLEELMRRRPTLFVVLADFEVRARRDPLIGAALHRDELGWRAGLTAIFEAGDSEGCWPEGITVDAGPELVIATLKGTRLAPERAAVAIRQLDRLLAPHPRRDEHRPT